MEDNLKLLVLEGREKSNDKRLGFRIDRSKVLNAIAAVGAKVRHDSGGRFIVIQVSPDKVEAIARLLPDARLLAVDADPKSAVGDMDATESLFVNALQIRSSKAYRDAKSTRKYGESPEEQQLMSGSCVREAY